MILLRLNLFPSSAPSPSSSFSLPAPFFSLTPQHPKPTNASKPRTTNLSSFNPRLTLPPTHHSSSDPGFRFRQKLLYLENDLGMSPSIALTQNPDLRSFPLPSILSITSFLRQHFGITHLRDAGRILSMHPILLTCTPQSDLLPVAQFLSNAVGISHLDDLRKAIVRCPRILVSDVESQLKPTLYFLRRIGFVGAHEINSQTSLLLVSSVETTLIPKLDYIQSLGFSYKVAVKLVLRSPRLFTHSIENNFKPKVEFLVGEMGRDVREVRDFPQYFSFSLEKKIKPRHRLLVEHGLSMTLAEMLKISDGEFNERLVEMRLGFI